MTQKSIERARIQAEDWHRRHDKHPTHEQIAVDAYYRWQAWTKPSGTDADYPGAVGFWLAAERALEFDLNRFDEEQTMKCEGVVGEGVEV